MGTGSCGVAHYTLITIPSLKVSSIEHLIRTLYINRSNVAEKSVNCNLTVREKANNKIKPQRVWTNRRTDVRIEICSS